MPCAKCEAIVETPDIPHIVRNCEGCGRQLRVPSPGPHGIGITVPEGARFVIPGSWIRFAFHPLKITGQLSRYGLAWYAEQVFVEGLIEGKDKFRAALDHVDTTCDQALKASELLKGIDISKDENAQQAIDVLSAHRDSAEWWHFLSGTFVSMARDAIAAGDAEQAAWATACVERCRSMVLYKEHLEEVVWMGHSAGRIVQLLRTWDGNRQNADELFWQATFKEQSYALSQVFAVPLVFIQDNAYVGGMSIDRKNAKLLDYLFSAESSREAVLVEIKTPMSKLLAAEYRAGVHPPSADLAGAVVQALTYRTHLMRELTFVLGDTGHKVTAFAPKCVVVAGNGTAELDTDAKRRSFELFRSNCTKDVEIVTYDELFRKLEVLANLFGLTRKQNPPAPTAPQKPTP